ncbi:hypothetical protein [Sneathiella limimaris]|uniref:hypothetical protein n=1 Tax=Sneathiella limimaris TaxID=1964213 RepID=UPI00146CAF01|nr:hypothetical protein [Sneathiella limimaris]
MVRAIIAGGSVAGLATAKALSNKFDEIIILEADKEPETIEARKGVPQGRHVHGLLKGGSDALTKLFPELPEMLEEFSAPTADFCGDVKWYLNKRFMPRFNGDLPIRFQSRPLLEYCIRHCVQKLPQVTFRYQTRVTDYETDPSGDQVVAVHIQEISGEKERIEGDLFIDATGRGSKLPKWLEEKGYGTVPISETRVDLGYASCFLQLPPDDQRDWTSLLIYPTGPDEVRGCTLVRVENDTWLLTLAGYHKDHPPSDKQGFLEFAKNLPRPEVYEAVKDAEFLSDISLHKFPSSIRRHYDRLKHFPLRLIPVGDTNVSLNPLFGQGMSIAFQSVQSLQERLDTVDLRNEGDVLILRNFYLQSLNRIFRTPWDLAMGQDFKYLQTTGNPPFGWKIKNQLKALVLSSSAPNVIESFFKVVHLIEPEKVFYRPLKMIQILASASSNDLKK